MNYLDKNKINIDSPRKNNKQFIRNNESILKTRQIFKTERHNIFMEEINMSKDLVSEKEGIKCKI